MAPPKGRIREKVLEAVMAHVAIEGMSTLTLRQLAAAIGTSHRMLVYHFGSKDELMIEVVRLLEQRQKDALTDLVADDALPPRDQMRRMWLRLIDPAMWQQERLFFEVYGQALHGRHASRAFLEELIESWVEPLSDAYRRLGVAEGEVESAARLALSVTRGLLMELLATGDSAKAQRTMEHFLQFYRPELG
jgi:AcrR family transcriptional regulator